MSKLIDALKAAEALRRKNLSDENQPAAVPRTSSEDAFWEASAAEERERELLAAAVKQAAIEREAAGFAQKKLEVDQRTTILAQQRRDAEAHAVDEAIARLKVEHELEATIAALGGHAPGIGQR